MTKQPPVLDIGLWQQFVEAYSAYFSARHELFTKATALVEIADRAQNTDADQAAAVEIAALLKIANRRPTHQQPSDDDLVLWRRFVQARAQSLEASNELLTNATCLVELVRRGLDDPRERIAAVKIAAMLKVKEREQLLDRLISLASYTHGQTAACRETILSLPRDWLLASF